MDFNELKRTESGYLASNNKTFREYGKVLKVFKDRYGKYAGHCLSDEMLFSKIAKEYIEDQKREMMFVSDRDDYKMRIRYASQFVIHDFASKPQVEKVLEKFNGKWDFDEVNAFLQSHYLYTKIEPETVDMIIKEKHAH